MNFLKKWKQNSPSVTVEFFWRQEFDGRLPYSFPFLIKNDFGIFQQCFPLTAPTFLATKFAIPLEINGTSRPLA